MTWSDSQEIASFTERGYRYNRYNSMKRKPIIIIPLLILLLYLPVHLSALPQNLEVFTDFEDISGEGEFFIGEEPNRVTVIGFKVEILEDPSLLHSGSKAITLGPGQEGRIFSQRGLQFLEFYAGETTGAGKFEIRGEINTGDVFSTDIRVDIVIGGSRGGDGGLSSKGCQQI